MSVRQPQTVYELYRSHAASQGDAPVVLGLNAADLSYHGLIGQIDHVAAALNAWGIGRGDPMMIQLPNGPEVFVMMHAAGAAAVCLYLDLRAGAAEVEHFLRFAQPKAMVLQQGIDSPGRALAQQFGVRVLDIVPTPQAGAGTFTFTEAPPAGGSPVFNGPDDLAFLLTTSGTTTLPKLVPKTSRVMRDAITTPFKIRDRVIDEAIPLRVLNYLPLHLGFGAWVASSGPMSGGMVACMPGFMPDRIFEWIDTYRPTFLSGPPAFYEQILARADQYPDILARHSLRYVNVGGSALSETVRTGIHQVFGVPIIKVYAMTEVDLIASRVIPPGGDDRPEWAGRAESVENTRVMASDGSLLPPGEVGEIVVRSDMFPGYWNNPEANEEAFIDGWYRSGDEGSIDADGNITIVGRIKEVINSGGAKVSPSEVEAVLKQHPDVRDAVVFGLRQAGIGETVAAAVVGSVSERELRKYASERLPFYKVPMRIILVDAIPTGVSGKVQRNRLAELLGLK